MGQKNSVISASHTVGPNNEIFVAVTCNEPPWFLHQGTAIAQLFLLPCCKDFILENSAAFWTEVVGPDRPMVECGLLNRGTKLYLPGMADTGVDVTIITHSE